MAEIGNYKYHFLIVIGVMLFSLTNCSKKENTLLNKELLDRINLYYDFEKNEEWEKTYYFRTPLYQKSIGFDYYTKKMYKDNKGRNLRHYHILETCSDDKYAFAKIEFVEKVPFDLAPKYSKGVQREIALVEISTWEKIDNIWYCRDACSRKHLSLNSDAVMNKNQRPILEELKGRCQ